MALDHYVPRLLTRPWEYRDAKLRYFDYCTREFEDRPAKHLLAKEGLNSREVEEWLNQTVEDPVGRYLSRLRVDPKAKPNARQQRALTLLFILNSQRIEEARDKAGVPVPLEQLRSDSRFLDLAVQYFGSQFKMFCRVLPEECELFFTEVAAFAIPSVGRPALAIPLGLRHVFVAYPGPLSAANFSSQVPAGLIEAASLGVGSDVHRVILPPRWVQASLADETDTRERLLDLRELNRDLLSLIGRASLLAGLGGWHATPR